MENLAITSGKPLNPVDTSNEDIPNFSVLKNRKYTKSEVGTLAPGYDIYIPNSSFRPSMVSARTFK